MSEIEREIRRVAADGGLPCAFAFSIAERFAVPPTRVREVADAAGVRIVTCQLGLFGYDAYGERRAVRSLKQLPPRLSEALRAASAEGRIPCEALWRLAESEGAPRMWIGCAAETEGLRAAPCQLGCF